MNKIRTVILGGGMSGLSCAYHLKKDYLLLERSDEPGGLSRSIKQDGFVFDHTGHLLHLRHPYTLQLIPQLLGDNWVLNRRRAWIYSNSAYTRYPFQANTYGLPTRVIKECLQGLLEAQLHSKSLFEKSLPPLRGKVGMGGGVSSIEAPPTSFLPHKGGGGFKSNIPSNTESFRSWVLRTFGKGFAKHFFFPYNEKLWTVPLDVLTAEWVAPFVPRPSVAEVIEGAFVDQHKEFGYNASFYYPQQGGIQTLAFAFAKHIDRIHLSTEATRIDLAQKCVTLSNGHVFSYDYLVTTIPLVRFMRMVQPLPMGVQEDIEKLRWTSVYNINLGVQRPQLTDKHWIYFPEKKFPFYRVGFPMNFSPKMTPPGCSSMYIEIAHSPENPPNDQEAMTESVRGLYACGLLDRKDVILTKNILRIPIAYVIFDPHRTGATNRLLSHLESQNVYSIGRFGAWKYSYMEEAILEGKATAEKIDGQ